MDAVRVGQAEAVAHSTPEGERIQPKLGYLSSGLRGNALRKVPEAGAPQAATTASDSARIRVGHEALVVVFLHDESECTLKLKTGHLHTVSMLKKKSSSSRLSTLLASPVHKI